MKNQLPITDAEIDDAMRLFLDEAKKTPPPLADGELTVRRAMQQAPHLTQAQVRAKLDKLVDAGKLRKEQRLLPDGGQCNVFVGVK